MEELDEILKKIQISMAEDNIETAKEKLNTIKIIGQGDIGRVCDLSLSAFQLISSSLDKDSFNNFYQKFAKLEDDIRGIIHPLANKIAEILEDIYKEYYCPF